MVSASGTSPSPEDKVPADPPGVQPQAIVRTWRATQSVARDPAGIASLIGLLVGIVLSVISTPHGWGPGVNSVGYALVGGAFFSFIYQFWANDSLALTISERIRDAHRAAYGETVRQWDSIIAHMVTMLDGQESPPGSSPE
jgi:hypothetical protein